MNLPFIALIRQEFQGYNVSALQKDLLAGITVGAVALPLALAFGIASGADAAAGLVTAIIAGFLIGGLSGAPYQISGPTGAMSAVLIVLANKYGLDGMWVAGILAGILIMLVGIFRLGRVVAFIPRPVVTGFTSGIAIIIFVGQLDNLFGVKTPPAENALAKIFNTIAWLFSSPSPGPNWQTILLGGIVIAAMFLLPKKITKRVPGSLIGIALAMGVAFALQFQAPVIGEIPRTLILDNRLTLATLSNARTWEHLPELFVPALSIAALGAIESLLCGAVAGNMTGKKMDDNQELIAQGLGNIVIPFFGGVPATAAIARSSVGITSGGLTRLTSIFHAAFLLAAAFLFAGLIGQIPMAALAGVLMVTAIHMNEWGEIRWMFRHRFKSAIMAFLVTMLATAALDLTQAVIIGVALSAIIFINQISSIEITFRQVDVKQLEARGIKLGNTPNHMRIAYLTGPMFFGAAATLRKTAKDLERDPRAVVILSMRGVPLMDLSGLEFIEEVWERQKQRGGALLLCAVQPTVKKILDRSRLTQEIGAENFFWSADQAIIAASERGL